MTPERWQAIERLYHAALARDPDQRAAFVRAECAGDDALREDVEALLARQPQADGFLEAPAWQSVAARLAEPPIARVGRVVRSFEVLAYLGGGGMGDVYRARDRRLGRDVALKFLTPEQARDGEAQERLRREALAASALNHPHICTLHDVVDDDGRPVLVMELVEGRPLLEIIPKDGLPIDTVVRIGEQLADALGHAHAHAIVHRDLKPSNIVVTTDGRAKVLDFGIARHLREAELTAVTQEHTALTGAGLIAGTLPYLAPEALRGQPADPRSDIWALGIVLYEMATGTRPFSGTTGFALTGAILHEPMTPLPARIPGTLRAIVQKCLAKESSQRYQSAREVGAALEMTRQGSAASTDVVHSARHAVAREGYRLLRWSALAALAGVTVAIAMWSAMRSREPATRPVSRLTISMSGEDALAADDPSVALSRDGRHVAYVVRRGDTRQIHIRPIDRFEARALAGTEGAHMPFFSPDGRWIGFFANGKLQKVSIDGGAPVTLCDAANGRGADWGRDDAIVFSPDGPAGLFRVPASGGVPQVVTALAAAKGEISHRGPQITPDGKAVIFTVFHQKSPSSIEVQSFATGERRTLVAEGASARYVPGGHLIYISPTGGPNTVAWTAPFDLTRLAVTGAPSQLPEDFRRTMIDGFSQIAVSDDGTLAFIPGRREAFTKRSLVWVDRRGAVTPLNAAVRPYTDPRLSPDGQRLAVTLVEPTGTDIWIYDLGRESLTRLTADGGSGYAVWSPDGTRIAFESTQRGRSRMFVRPADGSGPAEPLPPGDTDDTQRPSGWSPDGRLLTFERNIANNFRDVWIVSLQPPQTARALVQHRGYQLASRLSPDGRWVAYISDESGQFETYVTGFPDGTGKWQVSSGGGIQPVWSRDGRELFFRNADKLMVAGVDTRTTFVAGQPTLLFQGRILSGQARNSNAGYDVSLDGQRFLMIQQGADDAANQLNVVLGWADELTRRARTTTNR